MTTATLTPIAELAAEMLDLASFHANGEPSAMVCIADGENLAAEGRHALALGWAVRSLRHSVGVFHPAFKAAAEALGTTEHPEAARYAALAA